MLMSANIYRFGPFRLDARERQLFAGENLVPLRGKVFDTLRVLADNPNRLMRKEELMRAVWPEGVVEENNLDHNICLIRKVLAQRHPGQAYIQTVPRQGYRFVAPPDVVSEPSSPVSRTSGSLCNLPSIVEREGPLEELRTALQAAGSGSRQLVFVTGESGIGKTTLVRQFLAGIDSSSCWIAHGQCLDQHRGGEAYMAVLEALSRLCRQNNVPRVLDALNRYAPAWLANMPGVVSAEQRASLQTSLLGLTPQRMLRELMDALEVLTANQLLIIVLEDLHWSDSSTLDFLSKAGSGHEPAHLLLLGTYRPAGGRMQPLPINRTVTDMKLRGQCMEIPLRALSMSGCEKYLATRLPGVPRVLGELLFRRTGGNPLFAQAVVDTWLSDGLVRQQNGEWIDPGNVPDIAVASPDSLRNMIEDEVRQLSIEDREIVEAASTVGVQFGAAAVAATLDRTLQEVEARCATLADGGRFFETRGAIEWPDGTVCAQYVFVHDLYQELIYRQIPAGRRVRLHQQIGERLESAFTGCEDQIASELAIHFREARDARRAIRYLRRAAEQCLQRGAAEEALFNLTSALQMLPRIPDQSERTAAELSIHALLAPALAARKGFGDEETERAFRRAYELSRKLGEENRQFPVIFGFAVMLELRGEYRKAQELMERYLPEQERRCGFIQEIRDLLACSLFHQGSFARALEHAQNGADAYRAGQHSVLSGALGENPGIDCYLWTALSFWFLGFSDQALGRAREALSLAEVPGNEYSLATAHAQLAFVYQLRRQPEEVRHWAGSTKELSARHGHSYRYSVGQVLHGWALVQSGQVPEGLAELLEGMSGCQAAGAQLDRPYHLALLAESYITAGDVENATTTLDEATANLQITKSFFYEAELWRLRGVVASMAGHADQAIEHVKRGVEVAQNQGARILQLRGATTLAKLSSQTRASIKAVKEVRSILSSISEGVDTPDVVAARLEAKRISTSIPRRASAA